MTAEQTRAWVTVKRVLMVAAITFPLSGCNVLSGVTDVEDSVDSKTPPEEFSFETAREKDPQSKLGAVEHPKILAAHGGAYSSPKLEEVLALVTGKLLARSDQANNAFDITILDSPKVNAFALPGGYLYVTRGLLALSNDTAEVAAVLAHEMAHVSSNHGIERSRATEAVGIADRVVKDVVTNPVAGEVAKASTKRRFAAFSQKQELQADAVGIKRLGATGFDPFAAARFLESMERYQAWRSALNATSDDMSSTHPSTPRRVELARRHARAIGPEGTGDRDHQRLMKAVDGLLFGDRASEGFVRGNRFFHTKLGITFSVPETYDLSNRADAVLATGPGEKALRFDAVDKPPSGSIEDYVRSGWINGLLENSVQQTKINGLPAALAKAKAGDWQFDIAVIEFSGRIYRFIMAAPQFGGDISAEAKQIVSSFRKMTKAEVRSIKPQRIRVVAARPTDTVATMAARMTGIRKGEALFRALNGLDGTDTLRSGHKYKIVTE